MHEEVKISLIHFQPSESSSIRVVAKCRPINEDEQTKGCKKIVKTSGDKVIFETAGKVLYTLII